jgi:hypothetical protein
MTAIDSNHNEIEVTPEMIEAGMREYSTRWLGLRDANDDIAREMVTALFISMLRSRRELSLGDQKTTGVILNLGTETKNGICRNAFEFVDQLFSSCCLKAVRCSNYQPRIMNNSVSLFSEAGCVFSKCI